MVSAIVFGVSLAAIIFFVHQIARVLHSPEYRREAEVLLSQKRIRKAARRS
jgi:hypothetical protein